jgi:RimJ/RimL family protein N-acetyltransferase
MGSSVPERGEETLKGAPRIEAARLVLRRWRDDDLEPWIAMNFDPRVTEFLARNYTREFCEARFRAMRDQLERLGYGWWVAEIRGGPAFAGVICLRDVPFEAHFTPAREIGWRFASETWGHGYATEGAQAALDFAFSQLQWDEVIAITSPLNRRSWRVMERLGMRRELGGDFDHPDVEEGHRLRRHVLYRIARPGVIVR